MLHDLPEVELLDGRAYPKVSPKRIHALVQGAAMRLLDDCAGERGQTGTEWRFRVGIADGTATELVPDVAYVDLERLCALEPADREEPPFAPDVAIEVRSPSFRSPLLREKIRKYLGAGSLLVLDVDPGERCVHAHTAAGVTRFCAGQRFATAAVPWLQFDVASLFAKIDLPKR